MTIINEPTAKVKKKYAREPPLRLYSIDRHKVKNDAVRFARTAPLTTVWLTYQPRMYISILRTPNLLQAFSVVKKRSAMILLPFAKPPVSSADAYP